MKTYLPLALGNGPTEPVGQYDPDVAGLLFDLLVSDPQQRRGRCIWDERLAKCAQEHAIDMATRGYFSHLTPEGVNANKRARLAGYALPNWYDDDKNYIESIAGGQDTAGIAWAMLLNSPVHRTHLLGLTKFYAEQTFVGTGFAYVPTSTQFKRCYVIVSAPPEVTA